MADNFSALRSPREEPSLFDQVRTASQPTAETQYELTNGSEGQLMKGLRTGAAGLSAGSFANQALSEEVAGNPDFERARDLALETQSQGSMYAPRVSSLRDIHSLGDAADYAAGSFGQGAVSMAPSLGAALLTGGRGKLGALTGFLGSAGSAYNLERGEAALGQYADPTLSKASAHDRDVAATTKGAINAGLESIVPASLSRSVLRTPTQSFLGHVGREALTEGLTETAQQGVGFGAEKYLDPSRTMDPVDLADAFVGGALTGGGVSAGALAPTHIAHAAESGNVDTLPASEPSPPPLDAVPPQTPSPGPDAGSPSYVSDMIDRFKSAAAETSSPVDFVKHVFGGGTAGQAEADLVPDHEDPGVLSAPDPEAALVARDAARAERAGTYAKELMESDTTPINVKEAIQAMNGDFSDQNNQRYVTGTYAAQKVGEKVGSAVNDFVKLSKDLVGGIQDRVSKKNLQEIEDADITPLVSLLAQRMGPANAPAAPKVARQLLAAANRISPDATISEATDRRLRALSSAVSDEVLDMVTDLSGSDGLRNAITKLRKIPSAQNDVQKSNGGSFLESMLKVPLGKTALNNLSQFVDEFGLQLKDVSKERRNQVLTALSAAFGSKREAQVVVEYYGNLKRAAHEKMAEADKTRSDDFDQAAGLLSEEDRANLTEKESAPESTYQFADAKALRPYRTFVGQQKEQGGMRRRLRESTIAGAQLRNAGADVSPVKMSQYVTETGGDHEAEVKRLAADIKDRIAQHEGRKGEDRSQQINELKGELDLLRHNYKEGGAQQALDLYEVLKVGNKEKNDTIATDEDIAKYSGLADQGDARNTRVTFEREDGTKFTLSAESMWKTQGTKEGSGKGENARARAKRLFADAAAAVLARPEVTKMVTAPEKITIDRGLDLRAKKTGSPEYRRKVAAALEAAGNDIKGLKSELDGMVYRYLDMKPDDPERAAIEEALMDGSVVSSLEDHGTADENVARAVTREKQRLYREAQGQIDAIKFDEDFDERDNNRKGVPGGEEEGELGPNKLPRTRANEELENPGTRRYEEDTGLAIGAEKRGSTLSVPEQEIYDRATKDQRGTQRTEAASARAGSGFVTLPNTGPHTAKDQIKSDKANKFIGRGAPGSSTDAYAKAWGTRANTGEYKENDVVFVSVNGNRPGALSPPWAEIKKAMSAGATLITDGPTDRARSFNTGERAVADFLDDNGYFEESPGTWVRGYSIDNATGQKSYAPLGKGPTKPEARLQEPEPGQPGSREAPHRIPMYYKIGNVLRLRKELRDSYSSSDSISALIERGDRTGTTRQPPGGVLPGHYITFPGVKGLYRVTGFEKIDLLSDAGREAWSKREGWSPEAADTFGSQVQHGKIQMQFERVDTSQPPQRKHPTEEQEGAPKPKTISEAAVNALYDIAVKENYDRLDTPEKVLRYAAMARALMDQLGQIPEDARTDQQQELLSKLRDDFKQDGHAAFDWDMLFDGLNPTTAQRAQLRDIVAKQSAVGPTDQEGPVNLRAIKAEVLRTRGKNVKVRMNRLFSELGASGEFTMDDDKTNRVIEIAINASNPLGVAWHESLHDFFAMLDETPAQRSIKRDLIAAADAPQVKKRLRELLADHPEALKQVESSPEERVAYMYQFWAADELKLGPTGQGIFDKLRRFFEDLFKIVGVDTRAGALLEALHKGKFADPSTVSEVLADLPSKRFQNKMEEVAPELSGALTKIFKTAPDRLREFHNDKLTELADRFSSERGKAGFIQNRFQQQGIWENRLAKIFEGTNAEQRRQIMTKALAMEDQDTPVGQALTSLFADMHNYMVQAGVKTLDQTTNEWVPLRKVEKFFPRIWDPDAIARNRSEFMQLLVQHGGLSTSAAATAADNLIDGREKRPPNENMELGFLPFAATTNERIFKFIDPANASAFAKFQNNDLADVTTQYIKQAVHRAEYAREFGNNGEEIAKLINKSGVTDPAELKNISNTVQALEGSLDPGHWSRSTKEIMSSVLTLQNITLLPLAIASQMVDPIVLAARSGKVQDAGKAFATAIKRLAGKKADGEDLAKMLGMITQESVLEAMGNAYGTTHMSKRMRDINRVFFKYNGMQGWNNSMRIAATAAGERYLIANKSNTKALDELGLEPSDIKVVNDRLDVSDDKVKQAMFRFVDQAVLRPSASHRPVWMSDPRFLLIAHLKQFTFAMQNVVLKRANRELDEGNPKPWAILALTMPVVLAADMAKFALTGTMPSSWGFKDYFSHAVSRSGLMGLGDFGTQATRGMQQGALPGESLLGPSIENLIKILRWGGGDPRISGSDVIDRTVPFAKFI